MAALTSSPPRTTGRGDAPVIVLEGIPWDAYEALRDANQNYHIRMFYGNGRLELMSPSYRHELGSRRLAEIIRLVTSGLGLPCQSAGSMTLRRKGKGPLGGYGKEPDSCFFLANEPRMRGKLAYDPAIDPPPDLAIEVEVSYRSELSLKIYAKTGVPEVWRYDGRKLWFGRLRENGTYTACDASLGLPMLTPEIVLEWLGRADELGESEWFRQLHEWVGKELAPRHRARKK